MDYQTAYYLIAAVLLALAYFAHSEKNRTAAAALAALGATLGFITQKRGPTGQSVL